MEAAVDESSRGPDIQFVVGEGQLVTARREDLARVSPVFGAMCLGPLAETGLVEVTDVSPGAMEMLVRHTESGLQVQLDSVDEACELLYAAKKYLVDDLADFCRDFVGARVAPGDVCRVLEFAEALDEADLVQICARLIRRRAREVLKEESFLVVGRKMLGRVLDEDRLEVDSEADVIDAASRWAGRACECAGLPLTGPNKRAVLGGMFAKLRFLSLRGTELFSSSSARELLSLDEFHDLLELVVKVDKPRRPLPGFCAVTERRGAWKGPGEFSYARLSRCPMCGSSLSDIRARSRCFRCRVFSS